MEKVVWKCSKCGYILETESEVSPPETCPSCKEKCQFRNVTCYTPECGMKGPDPRLV